MALQYLHVPPSRWVPDPHGAVTRGGHQQLAVARECHRGDPGGVALQCLRVVPSRWVPDPDVAVAGGGRQQLAVV